LIFSTINVQNVDVSSGATSPAASRREDILAAAQAIFIHYGFARASLELIAGEAGISRTGLYHHFGNKDEIFRAVVTRLHEASLAAAANAVDAEGPAATRLLGVLRAKLGWFYDRLAETRHGNEIVDESNRLCGEAIAEGSRSYQRMVAKLLREADKRGEIDLASAGMSADAAATFVVQSAYGLQGQPGGEAPTPAQYDKRLEQLCRVAIVGLGGAAA
jgi:AcrR family transcriptional regulator